MEKWKLKSYIKTSIIVETYGFFGLSICFITLYVLESLGYIETELNFLMIIRILALLFLSFIVISILPVYLIYIITNIMKKKNEINSHDYYRDIEEKYTPAIASFIIDYKVER